MSERPTVALWHPFTARSIGWPDERDLPRSHSAPHVAALRSVYRTDPSLVTVHYLTDRLAPWSVGDGPRWRFWPRSHRWSARQRRFRHEWSRRALATETAGGAEVAIINTSGHGGRLARELAWARTTDGRPYVAMVGGVAVSTAGEQRTYYRGASQIVVHNRAAANQFAAEGLGNPVVLPLGVDPDLFRPDPEQDDAAAPTLLYVGRLTPWKGVDLLIDAHATVARALPGVRLRLVGPDADADYTARLHRQVDARGTRSSVDFVGPVDRTALVIEYQRASLVVLASENEGFGMMVIESMACGTPVIALDGPGGPAEIIEDGVTGVLSTKQDLAPELVRLLRSPTALTELGQAARREAADHYSTERTAEALAEVIDRAMRSSTRR